MTIASLLVDTAVTPLGNGGYCSTMPASWNYMLPSGGVVMTTALRAAEAELADPSMRLTSATTVFCTPVPVGELTLRATVLRRGRGASQVRVELSPQGQDVAAHVLATFTQDRPGPDVLGARFPDVPMPTDDGSFDLFDDHPRNPLQLFPFSKQFEWRFANGTRSWLPEHVAGPARIARWVKYRVAPRTRDGRFDRLAHPPIIDTMPGALSRAIGPSPFQFYSPSLDLTVHIVDDTTSEWLLLNAYVRRARAGIATGEIEVWDDQRRLIAYGTQTMFLRTITGEPPTVDASQR